MLFTDVRSSSSLGRKAAHWLGFNRSSLRYRPKPRSAKQQQLETLIIKFSREHPTLGYKKIAGLLRSHGYLVNRKMVQRMHREEGLQVPQSRPRLRRQGLSTGLPQRAIHRNHVWAWILFPTTPSAAARCAALISSTNPSKARMRFGPSAQRPAGRDACA